MGFDWKTIGNTIPLVNIILNLTNTGEDTTTTTATKITYLNYVICYILLSFFAIVININRNKSQRFTFKTLLAAIYAPYYIAYILIKIKIFDKEQFSFTL